MKEGSLQVPKRQAIAWRSSDYHDETALDEELRRVFDICHGCRLCFSLCDSFPRLFDLVDAAGDSELAGVDSADFKSVADACTLCDMCFMSKCPYVPPHEFGIDFPQLMLRYRAVERDAGCRPNFIEDQLSRTDRNGALGVPIAGLANRMLDTVGKPNGLRGRLKRAAGLDPEAALPNFSRRTLLAEATREPLQVNAEAPAFGRKALIYATCYGNYHSPTIGLALRRVLAHNGAETEVIYPGCCGMPRMEQGDLAAVANAAQRVSSALLPWVEAGYSVVPLVPSCSLMLKSHWPLLLPDDESVARIAAATRDASEYVVEIAAKEGLAPGLGPLGEGVNLHIACHAKAQNKGRKAAEMLRLIPELDMEVIERCSGHGGAWGVLSGNFSVALKQGKPVARKALESGRHLLSSECPLAGTHIGQCMDRAEAGQGDAARRSFHPIELFARAYGFCD